MRRPSVFKEAVSFAIVHRAFYDYMAKLARQLDDSIREIESESADPAPRIPA